MKKVSEIDLNKLTNKHIGRILSHLEQDAKISFWAKQSIKKEMWLFMQNVKIEMYKSGVVELDDKEKVWDPVKAIKEQNGEFQD